MRYASFVVLAAMSITLASCNSRERAARNAFQAYQAAAATGDLPTIRNALLTLVAADEGVADYWVQLGKVHAALGASSDAYFAFTRAHELNRADPAVLQAMTQLALRGGNLELAEQNAKELGLLSPEDPAVRLTIGYVALRRGNFDDAEKEAETLLAKNPYDSSAKILKSRILLRKGDAAKAIALLADQVKMMSTDIPAIRTLIGLADRQDDSAGVAHYATMLLAQQPDNMPLRLQLIEAYLHGGQIEPARQATLFALKPDAPAKTIAVMLAPWAEIAPRPAFAADAERLAQGGSFPQQLAYAAFLNRVGQYQAAARISTPAALLPVIVNNVEPNAILATAWSHLGQLPEAKERFDAVLAVDGGQPIALRGRSELALQMHDNRRAIEDAQKFVSVLPTSADARILLARCFEAAGDRRNQERTLWDAFHEIPANRNVFGVLRAYLARTQGPDAVARLTTEYNDQRDAEMTRDFL